MSGAAQDLAPLGHGQCRPGAERPGGRLHGGIHVRHRRGGHRGERATLSWIEDLERIAGIAVLDTGDERAGVGRVDGAHAPTNSALRFSANACNPASASLVRDRDSISSASIAGPSSSDFPPPSWTQRLIAAMARAGPDARRSAYSRTLLSALAAS